MNLIRYIMSDYPKHIKRALSELNERAYEAELGRALVALRAQFGHWERGDITAFELSDAIHQFHHGIAHELYSRYADSAMMDYTVAHAIASGILDRNDIDPEILSHIARALNFAESA